MSMFIRLSAAVTLAFVAGSVVGIEVGGQPLASVETASVHGRVAAPSPGAGSRSNAATRAVIDLDTSDFGPGATLVSVPLANASGPTAGNVRIASKTSRAVAPACLIAMN
jgi:hypothetical protein